MHQPRRYLVAGLAAASLFPAGCGDAVATFREDELRPVDRRAEEQRNRLASALRSAEAGHGANARLLEAQLARLQQTYAQLAELDPPGEVRETYERFVEANARFVSDMRQYIAAFKRRDEQAMKTASERAKQSIGAAHRAIQPVYE